jgi:16S rRNA (guanine527-N7)-methyltransferase
MFHVKQGAMSRQEARDALGLTEDQAARLEVYLALLAKWTRKINLVGPATMDDPWRRHILDSAQILALLPEGTETLVDLGSGAGLPGLILALLGVPQVHLVESDLRKCAFLREAARVTSTAVTVHAQRIEAAPGIVADVVTARALASLDVLIGHARRFLKPGGQCLFLKGARYGDELTEAQKSWHMTVTDHVSRSDPAGRILRIALPARGVSES